jgi:hypothetical protein
MATTKVSELSALTTTDGAEELLINDGGTSKKVTIANLLHDNSIDSDHYVDGSIDNAHLADDAVGTDEIADDAVTADKLANAINTAIAANTAKNTNATHTGDVTGSGALTIAVDAVDIAMLSATGSASSSTFLRGDNSWVTPTDTNTTYSVTDGQLSEINFTSADHSKLNAIEASATADQSNAEIVAAVEAGSDSNTFTDADHSKLNAIEASADVTDATNVTAAGALMDSECAGLAALKLTTGTFLTADQTKLDAIEASADVTDATNVTAAGALMDSELAGIAAVKATTGTFLSADESKLDAIEAAADVTDATNVASAGAGMLTVDQAWTGSQRATLVTDNDGSFDLNAGQNFKCTPAGGLTLTFTNFANGQSGYIILVNSGGHAIARHGDSIADANFVATVSAAGTYIISYISDGTDAFLTNSAIMA